MVIHLQSFLAFHRHPPTKPFRLYYALLVDNISISCIYAPPSDVSFLLELVPQFENLKLFQTHRGGPEHKILDMIFYSPHTSDDNIKHIVRTPASLDSFCIASFPLFLLQESLSIRFLLIFLLDHEIIIGTHWYSFWGFLHPSP
jgi:hypothetical protein